MAIESMPLIPRLVRWCGMGWTYVFKVKMSLCESEVLLYEVQTHLCNWEWVSEIEIGVVRKWVNPFKATVIVWFRKEMFLSNKDPHKKHPSNQPLIEISCSGDCSEGKKEKRMIYLECILRLKYMSGATTSPLRVRGNTESPPGLLLPFRCLHNHFRSGVSCPDTIPTPLQHKICRTNSVDPLHSALTICQGEKAVMQLVRVAKACVTMRDRWQFCVTLFRGYHLALCKTTRL